MDEPTEEEKLARRRAYVARMAPLGVLLIVGGLILEALASGFLQMFGDIVLVSGLAVLVGLIPHALAGKPTTKE
jgi:hypothetical protein